MSNFWWSTLCVIQIFFNVRSQECPSSIPIVYVSRTKGSDLSTCGSKTHPCKTIAIGVQRAQHDACVYVDGTGSQTAPYDCKSFSVDIHGAHLNKSLSIIGVQSMVHIKCQEGYFDINLNKSVSDAETIIKFTNIKFIDTTLQVQDANLFIYNCIFTIAKQAVRLTQVTKSVSLSFINSICMNTSSCITFDVKQRVLPSNRMSIEVINSFVVSSWLTSTTGYASGLHVESTSGDKESMACRITLKNVTVVHNLFGSHGFVFVNLKNALTQLQLDNVVVSENKLIAGVKEMRVITVIAFHAAQQMTHSTFRDNPGGVLRITAEDRITSVIEGCSFESNTGTNPSGLVTFSAKQVDITIDSTVITNEGRGGVFDIGTTDNSNSVHNATLIMRNVTVLRSYCNCKGSVISVTADAGSIIIQNTSTQNTRAKGRGGVVFVYLNKNSPGRFNMEILNSTFSHSKSDDQGGVFFGNGVEKLHMDNVVIDSGITSGEPGGAVYISKTRKVALTINNSIIKNCFGDNGVKHRYGRQYGSVMHFSTMSSLKITNSLFESNRGPCLKFGSLNANVLLRNVTFKECVSYYAPGGAIYFDLTGHNITIESCKFISNASPHGWGGAVAYYDLNTGDKVIHPGCVDPNSPSGITRKWSYHSKITIKDSIFVNNSAISGGALYLSRGNHTYQRCSFSDNFAKLQGGHIFVSPTSTSLTVTSSTFSQRRSTCSLQIYSYRLQSFGRMTFYSKTFIESQSIGPVTIIDSNLESKSHQDDTVTLLAVSKSNNVNFGTNNNTLLTCPRGSKLDILDLTTTIDTQYHSRNCYIAIVALQFTCEPCWVNTYSLLRGRSIGKDVVGGFKCLPCPFGAECAHGIKSKANFWGYEVEENPKELAFTLCPLGYCKQPSNQDYLDYNSCQGNRTGWLCGQCKDNYSETLLSPYCRHDSECQDTWVFGMTVIMVTLMALYLVHKPGLLRVLPRQILWFRNQDDKNHQSNENFGGGFLKIIFYFYQVANLLLITTSSSNIIKSYFLQPVLGIFNFHFHFSSNGLLCPLPGLTAVTKQLLFASQVFGVAFMVAVCYCCHSIVRKYRSNPPPNLGPYLGAALETMLLGYAVYATTALQLLRCKSFTGQSRLFIAGNVLCYQWWQYVLMVFVGAAVFPFTITLGLGSHWLHKGTISLTEFFLGCVLPLPYLLYKLLSSLFKNEKVIQEHPEWTTSVTQVLMAPFRTPQSNSFGAVYWEGVLIFRRLVLILIYVFVADPLSKELLLTMTCVLILSHHMIVRPYRDASANNAEFLSLFCLVFIAIINSFKASNLSNGQTTQDPLQSSMKVLEWIQILLIIAVPILCLLAIVVAIISQIVRLVFKVSSWAYARLRLTTDERESLLESTNSTISQTICLENSTATN